MALESSSDEETSERKQEDKLIFASNQVFRVMLSTQNRNVQQAATLWPGSHALQDRCSNPLISEEDHRH
jgi:hypothetical protein